MRCNQVQNLLPEYVEGALAVSQQEALSAHLHACPTCAAEERSYQLAFNALSARKTGNAPDLWAAFSARLANELSCAEVRELIPLQADPALLAHRADALNFHLAACAPCAAESAVMSRAVTAIEAVSVELSDVDLWPAFAARTGNAPARTSVLGSIRRALSHARNPLAAPILAMTAFAGIVFGAQYLLSGNSQTEVAVKPLATSPARAADSRRPKVGPDKSVASAANSDSNQAKSQSKNRRGPAAMVSAPAPVAKKPDSHAAVIAKITGTARPRLKVVAFDPGITPTADVTLVSAPAAMDSNSESAQEKVMPEVVQAVALLLDFGDSASHPFGGAE